MKLSLLAVLAAVSFGSTKADPTSDNAFHVAKWCCFDSNEKCADACEFINDYDNQATYDMLDQNDNLQTFTLAAMGLTPINGVGPFGFSTIENVPALCRQNTQFQCCDAMDGYVCGDPHFSLWSGKTYDYQGECDLKFLSAPKFAKGLGLDIHIRTTIKFDYSYISSAVIKIGDSMIEIGGWGEYILNGVEAADMPGLLGDSIPVTHEMKSKKTHVFIIDVAKVSAHGDGHIKIQTFKDWVSIHLEHPQHADYDGSTGMLGSFPKGERLARDGLTILEDDNAFGQEWQILPEEAGLFQGNRYPQHPSQCILPSSKAQSRRLAESKVTEEQAEAACAHLESHKEMCVRDVMATGDLEGAGAFAF